MEPLSALEQAIVSEFQKCTNRQQVRRFVKRLSKRERAFLIGEAKYREMMADMRAAADG